MIEFTDYINHYIFHKGFDLAILGLKKIVPKNNKSLENKRLQDLRKEDCIEHIGHHLEEMIRWSTSVTFRDILQSKDVNSIFIDLDLNLTPLKLRANKKSNKLVMKSSELLNNLNRNTVILGQPGAGKTTTIKKTFLEAMAKSMTEDFPFSFPLLIRLKTLNKKDGNDPYLLIREIIHLLGLELHDDYYNQYNFSKNYELIFKEFINNLNVLIILDGFDEISDYSLRNNIISSLRKFSDIITNSKFIITSRSADFDFYIEGTQEFEISSLSQDQIKEFIEKWLLDKDKASRLLVQLKESPYWDTTIRPLTLAHLCALQERNNSIPEKPKSVYIKIITLLLEDWTNQASIIRNSKYASFTVERKIDFLMRFAYELTIEYSRSEFDLKLLDAIYIHICNEFELPANQSKQVIREIESHNGLIIQTGIDTYEFVHKSIQEYLVAEYLIKQPILIDDLELIANIPNEIAIMISLSTNPNLTLYKLCLESFNNDFLIEEFYKKFLTRLIVEKPDYKPNALFAISLICMVMNLEMYTQRNLHFILSERNSKYMNALTLARKIMELTSLDIMGNSLRDLNNYYNLSSVKANKDKYKFLSRVGKLTLYRRNQNIFKFHNKIIELPRELISPF